MRALSLRQPFAWLTVYCGKNPENRTWDTTYRGWFLIHASAQYGDRDVHLALGLIERLSSGSASRGLRRDLVALERSGHQLGGIVGAAYLQEVQEPWTSPGALPDWRLEGQYGYVLPEVVPLPFIPCKGLQRFWRCPAALEREVERVAPAHIFRGLLEAEERFVRTRTERTRQKARETLRAWRERNPRQATG